MATLFPKFAMVFASGASEPPQLPAWKFAETINL
jgi:hypothetical protein